MALNFTGERFLPWMHGSKVHYEHLHRYNFARQFIANKSIIDIACGEGYGSSILSAEAKCVVGIDLDEDSIAHAQSKYQWPNLSYKRSSMFKLPFEDNTFDVAVCFEALEHVSEHDVLMHEILRILKCDGLLIISTPNKKVFTDHHGYQMPFHIRELYFQEFRHLLFSYFTNCEFFGQKVLNGSDIWGLDRMRLGPQEEFVVERVRSEFSARAEMPEPMFYICVASNGDIPLHRVRSQLIDDSLYAITETRECIAQIQKLKEEIDKLKADGGVVSSAHTEITGRSIKEIIGISVKRLYAFFKKLFR
ncbi:MAG: class I SAM-dependent methyltransferase [bacterium]|nr:class I SAM-dependent methyltransferase [bacterium]